VVQAPATAAVSGGVDNVSLMTLLALAVAIAADVRQLAGRAGRRLQCVYLLCAIHYLALCELLQRRACVNAGDKAISSARCELQGVRVLLSDAGSHARTSYHRACRTLTIIYNSDDQ